MDTYSMRFTKLLLLVCSLLLVAPINAVAENPHAQPGESGVGSGKVMEVINVSGYTYLKLENREEWIATPTLTVFEGDQVEFAGGVNMGEFYSKTLDRTFNPIFFVGTVTVTERDVDSMHSASIGNHDIDQLEMPSSNMLEAPKEGEIPLLDNGLRIEDIYGKSDELSGQVVRVIGKVIKVNENINGKNWITLSDGSGVDPNDKLLATSADLVSLGDIVIAQGKLVMDVDIGFGYKYSVLLEETIFSQDQR